MDKPLIDIGVNFHSSQLAGKTEDLLRRAKDARVTTVLATGTSLDSSVAAWSIAVKNPGFVYATAGVHPHSAKSWSDATRLGLEVLWSSDEVVAIGECGLDYCRNFSSVPAQRSAFEAQLDLAVQIGKPLFLHCRDAFADFCSMLAPAVSDGAYGVVHCFTGTLDEAEVILGLGLDIGITGWVADPVRGDALRHAVSKLPLERLHLETDAPYLSPRNMAKRRSYNEPANLRWVAEAVAEVRCVDVEVVIAACTANSRRLFGLDRASRGVVSQPVA